ncbi:hypothetical protein Sjap_024937 [Stephania japonica]|uniref:Uncharacterized protein n=1 Tax=Stephania japonica TaxID=461633 RepID=A0AAP0EGG2_9MAGN
MEGSPIFPTSWQPMAVAPPSQERCGNSGEPPGIVPNDLHGHRRYHHVDKRDEEDGLYVHSVMHSSPRSPRLPHGEAFGSGRVSGDTAGSSPITPQTWQLSTTTRVAVHRTESEKRMRERERNSGEGSGHQGRGEELTEKGWERRVGGGPMREMMNSVASFRDKFHHLLIIIIAITTFLVFSLRPVSSANTQFIDCEPKKCGENVSVEYPFWISSEQPSSCGNPLFEIACRDKKPTVWFSGDAYVILNINYENQSLLLADADAFDEKACVAPLHNVTHHLWEGLSLSPYDFHLYFFYNCTDHPPPFYKTYSIPCLDTALNFAALLHGPTLEFLNASSEKCDSFVGAPVYIEEGVDLGTIDRMKYTDLLKEGFLLNWNLNSSSSSCDKCRESGGRCGHIEGQFMCFCRDHNHTISCDVHDRWYHIKSLNYSGNEIFIHDQYLQEQLDSNTCNSLDNITIPESSALKFTTPIAPFYRCKRDHESESFNHSISELIEPLYNFSGCDDSYDLYFSKDPAAGESLRPSLPETLIDLCSTFWLPRIPGWDPTEKGLASLFTACFHLRWEILRRLEQLEELGLCGATTEDEKELSRKMTIVGLSSLLSDFQAGMRLFSGESTVDDVLRSGLQVEILVNASSFKCAGCEGSDGRGGKKLMKFFVGISQLVYTVNINWSGRPHSFIGGENTIGFTQPSLPMHYIVVLIIDIIVFKDVHCKTNHTFINCYTSFDCADIKGIGYPFWGGRHQEYCGHPGYHLECKNGNTTEIEIMSMPYRVLGIDQETHIMRIARKDFMNSPCPSTHKNSTINTTLFNYTPHTMNLRLFYDCPIGPMADLENMFDCNKSSRTINYYYTNSSKECPGRKWLMTAAVLGAAGIAANDILRGGFEVDILISECLKHILFEM